MVFDGLLMLIMYCLGQYGYIVILKMENGWCRSVVTLKMEEMVMITIIFCFALKDLHSPEKGMCFALWKYSTPYYLSLY